MYVVAVNLVVDPSNADAFAERLKQHAKNSLTQEGCLGFSVSADHDRAGSFHLWEVYKDAAAFEDHKNADFMATFREYSAPLVLNRVLATGDQIG
ncbi:MAG: antibiotic biosynthesis monooxygenase [Alphaproteobacteria bacterium]|nr:antibiotic biosynthesis monooxygenase [Alphaproteobacteria bacterium]